MTNAGTAEGWASVFGLALAPLFERDKPATDAQHHVLLDGGYGTFALSLSQDELWRSNDTAAWAWSSDIPHHVTLTPQKVAVVRWDRPGDPKVYERVSVERSLERFYTYLRNDRLRSNKSVIDHLLGLFRRLRSLAHVANIPDERTTAIFTATLATLIAPDGASEKPVEFGVPEDAFSLCEKLSQTGLSSALEEVRCATGSLSQLALHPALTIRHASGLLFQEAHFELLRAPDSADLFGLIGAPEVKPISRGGTHFTPPALARSIVEQTLAAIDDLTERQSLSVCDPACGSGAFLHETLRALRRFGFAGRLKIIGQDQSPAAVTMAEFVLRVSLRDWAPAGGVELVLKCGDSLGDLRIPASDVIVMNPPFVSSGSQTALQRQQLKEAVGETGASRGDLSMAFVTRALEAVNKGGAVGTLFPASLLSLKAATGWRENLANAGELRLLAALGDYGLFAHALVQVACAVVRKAPANVASEFTALVTQNEPQATSEALRWLRKAHPLPPSQPITESTWSIFPASVGALRGKATWRLNSPVTDQVLRLLEEAQLPSVGELFQVRQGILTGLNEVFLLDKEQYLSLPKREQQHFRPATMTDSIQGGKIVKEYFVFYPYGENGPLFSTEDQVRSSLPAYFRDYLAPHRERLEARGSLRQSNRKDWWGLNRPRPWAVEKAPRILTKFFGAEGAFVGDVRAGYLPVMGHAWFPTAPLTTEAGDESLSLEEVLLAYTALLNSRPFARLLAVYSPHVAGGQFDLSVRHVSAVPLPNLRDLSKDPVQGALVSELIRNSRDVEVSDPVWQAQVSNAVLRLYGTPALAEL